MLPGLFLDELKLKTKKGDDKDAVESVGSGKKINAGIEVKKSEDPRTGKHILVVAPGSGTSQFDKAAIELMKTIGQVHLVLLTNRATGNVMPKETSENLEQAGALVYDYMVKNPVFNLVFAGSRGGFVVGTVIKMAMASGKPSGLGSVRFLVKNAFEETPRSWFKEMNVKPPFPLVTLTGGQDYMNNDLKGNEEFFKAHWDGPALHIHADEWAHQMVTPAFAINLALGLISGRVDMSGSTAKA